MRTKQCPRCKETKDADAFGVQRSGRINSTCKECRKSIQAERRARIVEGYKNGKKCVRCGEVKPGNEGFFRRGDKPWLLHSQCIECRRQLDIEGKKRFKEKSREEYSKRLRKANLAKYGITPEQYDELLQTQKGKCKICGHASGDRRVVDTLGNKLYVDHCHKTGEIRGLLCSRCNRGIGYFDDDPDLLKKAIRYLYEAKVEIV